MKKENTVYFSIGSNQADRLLYLKKAIVLLEKNFKQTLLVSRVYESASWGFSSTDFYNACCSVVTHKSPKQVLEEVLEIEKQLGRVRDPLQKGYTSRVMDIDVLFYQDLCQSDEDLTLPHPHIQDRNFVLYPLADIAPDFIHPVLQKSIRVLKQDCTDSSEISVLPFSCK